MLLRALVFAVPAALLAACTEPAPVDRATSTSASALATPSAWTLYQGSAAPSATGSWAPYLTAKGTFLPHRPGATAVSYDPAVVPPGAAAEVAIGRLPSGTAVRLSAAGLVPRRPYGAHLHVRPCTATPDQAGPHYQHRPDPAAAASPPSVNPSYANPRNEIWLDFTADAYGSATATTEVAWSFAAGAAPRSLVLHAQQTRTSPGVAGTAGARVACLTLPTS